MYNKFDFDSDNTLKDLGFSNKESWEESKSENSLDEKEEECNAEEDIVLRREKMRQIGKGRTTQRKWRGVRKS